MKDSSHSLTPQSQTLASLSSSTPPSTTQMLSQASALDDQQQRLLEEIRIIKEELQLINQHRLIKVYGSLRRLMAFYFLRGVMIGFGTVIGATVVVSIFLFLLSQIEFIPLIGEWVRQIIDQIQSGKIAEF